MSYGELSFTLFLFLCVWMDSLGISRRMHKCSSDFVGYRAVSRHVHLFVFFDGSYPLFKSIYTFNILYEKEDFANQISLFKQNGMGYF